VAGPGGGPPARGNLTVQRLQRGVGHEPKRRTKALRAAYAEIADVVDQPRAAAEDGVPSS
jgi:hypothetical protein